MTGWANVLNASKYADVSEGTMRGWLNKGLKHSRLPTGTIRIKYSDIDEFLGQYAVDGDAIDTIVEELYNEIIG